MNLYTVVFLLAFAINSTTGSTSKDVVLLIEQSSNIKNALEAFITGAAGYFRDVSVYDAQPFQFTIYTYELSGPVTTVIFKEKHANKVIGTLSALHAAPATACSTACCCSDTGFAANFEAVLAEHAGHIIVNLISCPKAEDKDQVNQWSANIQRFKTTVYNLRPTDNFCISHGSSLDAMRYFGLASWYLNSSSFKDILPMIAAVHHNSTMWTKNFRSTCDDVEMKSRINWGEPQAVAFVFSLGRPQSIAFNTPSGAAWTGITQTLIHDEDGTQMIILHSPCPDGWTYYSNQCVWIESRRLTYEAAAANCRSKRSTLFSEFDSSFDAFVGESSNFEAANDLDIAGRYWISLDDINARRECRWNLSSTFVALSNVGFSLWSAGEPNPLIPAGSRCVALSRFLGLDRWSATFCRSLLPSICTRPIYEFAPNSETKRLSIGVWQAEYSSFESCEVAAYAMS